LGAWRTGFGKHGPWDFGLHFFFTLIFYFWLEARNEKAALGSMQVFRINVCGSSVAEPNAAVQHHRRSMHEWASLKALVKE
jgi:hypothetical protein